MTRLQSHYCYLQFAAVSILYLILTGCYYQRDLQNQTVGSAFGGLAGGIIAAESGGSLAGISTAIIGGSILGSIVGQCYDNHSPLMRDNPLTSPVRRYYYSMFRPTLQTNCFRSGNILYKRCYRLPYLRHTPCFVNQLDPKRCIFHAYAIK